MQIRLIQATDIQPIAAAFAELGWQKPASQYEQYLSEQQAGSRVVLVAWLNGEFSGYVTIVWRSHYPAFALAQIPEIVDFNVLPKFRRQGLGMALMDEAERRVAEVSPLVRLGVGLTADYGSAQRMYVKRGYLPDGRGAFSAGQPVVYGQSVPVDDDLVLFLTKKLRYR
jgi:GNAT superfamily N-acetyltransferase